MYYKQVMPDGLQVLNGDMNVNVLPDGSILSMGESFFKGVTDDMDFAAPTPKLSFNDAKAIFYDFIHHTQRPIVVNDQEDVDDGVGPGQLVYIHDGKTLSLGWQMTVQTNDHWFDAVVNANDGAVMAVSDWVADASYNVYPINVNDPQDGERQWVENPENKEASPWGWNKVKDRVYETTIGNNVDAYGPGRQRPNGGKKLDFDFQLDLTKEPSTYLEAATTQLFYTINQLHDILYSYGFDEKAGNFQTFNFGRGGLENDAVLASAQDASGTDNANFATPPDGMPGQMRMYVWTNSKPKRDGDLEAGIVIHEYMHGVSTRLTGGPANSNCLGSGEAGGMGEGWGDFVSLLLRQRSATSHLTPFPMGAYSANTPKGIRKYMYALGMEKNPSTYAFVTKMGYNGVHAKGEVWAEILWTVYHDLVTLKGFSNEWIVEQKTFGNQIMLQLILDGMKLQPCRPTFIDARDAILLADKVSFNSAHTCVIWRAFASRGLGTDARSGGKEGFAVPAECLEYSL